MPVTTQNASSTLSWFAVRVKSNFERTVSACLSGKGLEEFLPTYRTRRQWTDRTKEIEQPLFSGYLFSRFEPRNSMSVLTTPGVVGIVSAAKNLLPVADLEIEAIRTIVRSGLLAGPWPFLQVGQRVELVRGPLAGLEGILVKVKNQHRLVVSVTLLQRSISTEIDGDWVKPLKPCFRINPVRAIA